ncbi:(Na+)-NQR maturation NqrM [Necropsobacter massiliensis]|uniref:(Na+)-NQR maturation NqrM n=1 Tax=Necropsobacter massiliensis TaxID=1400001 RepID=UPI00050953BF|nr:(Na+)-NQR maturation NqrM [Necropsobacter massiliensis]
MQLFLITFGLFILVILGMSLGYIVKKKSIAGSCGGISSLGLKKVCDCEEPCDNLKEKVAKGEADPAELARFNKNQTQFYEVK